MAPLVIEFGETYKITGIEFKPDKVIKTVNALIKQHLMVVIDDNGIQGGIGGLITEGMFSEGLFFQELMLYVRDSHRAQTIELLKFTEDICKTRGVTAAVFGQFSNSKVIERFYRRQGYEYLETHYIKRLV